MDLPRNLWVVVAAYGEAARIGEVLRGLLSVTPNVVVVDDGSRDATAQRVLEHSVWLVRHRVNLGQGAALQTGIDFALEHGADSLVTFDADGQHDPRDLRRLVEPLQRGEAHFTLGSRFLGTADGMPWMRRLVLKAAIAGTRILSGIALSDAHNGLRAMTAEGARRIRLTMNRMEHASEIVQQIVESGLPFVEVPVRIRYTPETLEKGQRSANALRLGMSLLLERLLVR